MFKYLCKKNAVSHNPVKGVKRPKVESGEGKTPALGDCQARDLLTTHGDQPTKEEQMLRRLAGWSTTPRPA